MGIFDKTITDAKIRDVLVVSWEFRQLARVNVLVDEAIILREEGDFFGVKIHQITDAAWN